MCIHQWFTDLTRPLEARERHAYRSKHVRDLVIACDEKTNGDTVLGKRKGIDIEVDVGNASASGRKAAKRKVDIAYLVGVIASKMQSMRAVMRESARHLGELAACFKYQSEQVARRMSLGQVLEGIEGLTAEQQVIVGMELVKDQAVLDYFCSLSASAQKILVHNVILPNL